MRQREVYFARCIGPQGVPLGAIKIGCSYGHQLRLRAIESNQPYSLELIASVPGELLTETLVHLYLRKHRIGGEFFHENAYVSGYVSAAADRGSAFEGIEAAPQGDHLPDGALDGFLKYHGITINQVCAFLGRDPKGITDIGKIKNRRLIAGAMLLVRTDGYSRYVHWPSDCVRGLLGDVHPQARPLIEAEAA